MNQAESSTRRGSVQWSRAVSCSRCSSPIIFLNWPSAKPVGFKSLYTELHTGEGTKSAGLTLNTKRKVAVDCVRSLNPLTRPCLFQVRFRGQIAASCCTKYTVPLLCERDEFFVPFVGFIKINKLIINTYSWDSNLCWLKLRESNYFEFRTQRNARKNGRRYLQILSSFYTFLAKTPRKQESLLSS